MTRIEQLQYLVQYFSQEALSCCYPAADIFEIMQLAERDAAELPENELFRLFRILVNKRPPAPLPDEAGAVQDVFLQNEIAAKGIEDVNFLFARAANSVDAVNGMSDIALWHGDCIRLKADAVVNAANSELTGCTDPDHRCVDNAIHTYAGVQLRYTCAKRIQAQGFPEPEGQAAITPGYNLPSSYIVHTVGPRVTGAVTDRDCSVLTSCYESCLNCAADYGCKNIVFCCIATGAYRFPSVRAARIAIDTVRFWQHEQRKCGNTAVRVVFCAYRKQDFQIYGELLSPEAQSRSFR